MHDCSNKAHGGFLGNSVIGSWCNLGAETTCSNLKNTYGEIAEWHQDLAAFKGRGRTFCGLLMGDHSKTAIHTAFNTATVVGAMCNVFGNATPPKHLPSFSWGWMARFRTLTKRWTPPARSWPDAAKRCPRKRNTTFEKHLPPNIDALGHPDILSGNLTIHRFSVLKSPPSRSFCQVRTRKATAFGTYFDLFASNEEGHAIERHARPRVHSHPHRGG